MPSISLPTGSYYFPEPRASVRRLVNCFCETAPDLSLDDAKNKDTPVILRRAPGTVPWANDGTQNPVRGLHMMQGILYAVIGPTLYSVSNAGLLTFLGTGIQGYSLVEMADNGYCLVVIVPNTSTGYIYFPGNTNIPLTLSVAPQAGAVSAALDQGVPSTANGWPYFITSVDVTFSDNEMRACSFVQGSPNFSWAGGLTSNSITVSCTCSFSGNFYQFEDPTFIQYGAQNVGFIDSYIVFLATNGKEFYNSDSPTISGTGPLTFTGASQFPREYGTDPFVGMVINQRVIYMFGQLTSECYIDAGNAEGTPFDSAPNNFMEIGCAAGLTVCKQNQTAYFLANDRTVRVLNGTTPTRVSNYGIEAILEQANIIGAYSLAYSIAGHMFYVLTLPQEGRTLVLDTIIGEWHELASPGYAYWRPYCSVNAYGMWLVGDSQSGQIGYLDTKIFTEFATSKTATWIHQPVYGAHNRIRHQRLEIVMGTGASPQLTAVSYAGLLEITNISYVINYINHTPFFTDITVSVFPQNNFKIGDQVSIVGVISSGSFNINNTWTVDSVDQNSFTFQLPGGTVLNPSLFTYGYGGIATSVGNTGASEQAIIGISNPPLLTLQISDDGGNTWRTMPTVSLGSQGNYLSRAVWYRLGMARDRVYQFSLSDPTEMWVTDAQLDILPAKH